MRKWRDIHSLHFRSLQFPTSKIVSFRRKMLIKALLSRRAQKTYETIILNQIHCKKAPHLVRACFRLLYLFVILMIMVLGDKNDCFFFTEP